MRGEGHIDVVQGTVLVYAILAAKLFIQYPTFLIHAGGPAAWQVALLTTVFALVLFLPLGALCNRFPRQGLAEISQQVAGPVVGSLITLAVVAWLFASLVVSLRNLAETYIASILPNTPPSMMILVALFCIGFASYHGLESLVRATQVLLPVIVAGIVIVLLLNYPRIDTSRLQPAWGYGLLATVSGGAYYIGVTADIILLLVLGYAFRSAKDVKRSGVWGLVLYGLISAATVTVLVAVFGAPDAAQQPFPLFNLSQLVYLGRFIQRTEALLVMFWFFNVVVRLAALFHGTVVGLTGCLRLPYHRPVIFPVAVLAFSLSLLPEDSVSLLRLLRDWIVPTGTVVLTLPTLLLVLAMVRRKRGATHAA